MRTRTTAVVIALAAAGILAGGGSAFADTGARGGEPSSPSVNFAASGSVGDIYCGGVINVPGRQEPNIHNSCANQRQELEQEQEQGNAG
ncbi:chaplin [Streptomyces sp. NPDC012623]|uniref:chaplin n=1 Tax=unclassified Streptomyces TaxID=2593676 RepID=UPI0036A05DD2